MRKIIDKLQARQQELAEKEDGFSLLELVVAVSIMLILAVVGFIAYQGLTDNARTAALDSASNQVLTAVIAADNSPNGDDPADVVSDYNDTTNDILVNITEATSGEGGGITITAIDRNDTEPSTATAPGNYGHVNETTFTFDSPSGE